MSESLSQREIDLILRGTAAVAPAESAVEVIPYDFLRPSRVSKDRQATLEAVFGRFALALQALLTSRLRTPLDVAVSGVEQMMFSEFMISLASPCASFVFRLGDRGGSEGVLDLGTDLGFLLVDRLFGGPGDAAQPRRAHTALEQAVIRGVAERAVVLLGDAWSDHVPMRPEISGFESNPAMLQIVGRDENVLAANLTVRSDTFSGFLTLCLPIRAFEDFLQEQAPARQAPGRPAAAEGGGHRQALAAVLQQAGVTVRVVLPGFGLDARTVAALAPGQVLQTGHAIDAPIEIHVNGRLYYHGTLGQVRRYVGVMLAQPASTAPAERPVPLREGRLL
jgi:flagellar motor switch protein FliM